MKKLISLLLAFFVFFIFCSCVRTVREKPSIPPAENVIEFPTEFKPFSFEDEDCNYCDARYVDGFEDDASVLPKIKSYFIDEKTNNLLYRDANNEVKAIARLSQPASVCAVVGNYIFILTDNALYRLKVDFNGGFDKGDFWLVADVPGFPQNIYNEYLWLNVNNEYHVRVSTETGETVTLYEYDVVQTELPNGCISKNDAVKAVETELNDGKYPEIYSGTEFKVLKDKTNLIYNATGEESFNMYFFYNNPNYCWRVVAENQYDENTTEYFVFYVDYLTGNILNVCWNPFTM